jgi:hypothetical protein
MHLENSLIDHAKAQRREGYSSMSSSLLLVNQDCFSDRMARKSHEIQSRLAAKGNAVTSAADNWFERIKSEAEGGTFERRGNVAVVKVMGALDYHYSFWSWLFDSSCYMGVMNAVTAAANDASINKIVLYLCCHNGGIGKQLLDFIDEISARSVKFPNLFYINLHDFLLNIFDLGKYPLVNGLPTPLPC